MSSGGSDPASGLSGFQSSLQASDSTDAEMMGLFDVPGTLGSMRSWDKIPAGYSPNPNPNRGYAAAMASADEQWPLRTDWGPGFRGDSTHGSGYPDCSQGSAPAAGWENRTGQYSRTRSCGPAITYCKPTVSKPPKPSREKSSNASRRSPSGNSPSTSTPRDRSLAVDRGSGRGSALAAAEESSYGPSRGRPSMGPIATTPYQLRDAVSQALGPADGSSPDMGGSREGGDGGRDSVLAAISTDSIGNTSQNGYGEAVGRGSALADLALSVPGTPSGARSVGVAASTISEGGNYGIFSAAFGQAGAANSAASVGGRSTDTAGAGSEVVALQPFSGHSQAQAASSNSGFEPNLAAAGFEGSNLVLPLPTAVETSTARSLVVQYESDWSQPPPVFTGIASQGSAPAGGPGGNGGSGGNNGGGEDRLVANQPGGGGDGDGDEDMGMFEMPPALTQINVKAVTNNTMMVANVTNHYHEGDPDMAANLVSEVKAASSAILHANRATCKAAVESTIAVGNAELERRTDAMRYEASQAINMAVTQAQVEHAEFKREAQSAVDAEKLNTETLRAKAQAMETEFNQMKSSFSEQVHRADETTRQLAVAMAEISRIQAEKANLESKVQEARAIAGNAGAERDQAVMDYSKCNHQRSEGLQRERALESKVQAALQDKDHQVSLLQQQIESGNHEFKTQTTGLRMEVDQLRGRLATGTGGEQITELTNKRDELARQVERLKETNSRLEAAKSISQGSTPADAKELEGLRAEVAAINEQRAQYEEAVASKFDLQKKAFLAVRKERDDYKDKASAMKANGEGGSQGLAPAAASPGTSSTSQPSKSWDSSNGGAAGCPYCPGLKEEIRKLRDEELRLKSQVQELSDREYQLSDRCADLEHQLKKANLDLGATTAKLEQLKEKAAADKAAYDEALLKKDEIIAELNEQGSESESEDESERESESEEDEAQRQAREAAELNAATAAWWAAAGDDSADVWSWGEWDSWNGIVASGRGSALAAGGEWGQGWYLDSYQQWQYDGKPDTNKKGVKWDKSNQPIHPGIDSDEEDDKSTRWSSERGRSRSPGRGDDEDDRDGYDNCWQWDGRRGRRELSAPPRSHTADRDETLYGRIKENNTVELPKYPQPGVKPWIWLNQLGTAVSAASGRRDNDAYDWVMKCCNEKHSFERLGVIHKDFFLLDTKIRQALTTQVLNLPGDKPIKTDLQEDSEHRWKNKLTPITGMQLVRRVLESIKVAEGLETQCNYTEFHNMRWFGDSGPSVRAYLAAFRSSWESAPFHGEIVALDNTLRHSDNCKEPSLRVPLDMFKTKRPDDGKITTEFCLAEVYKIYERYIKHQNTNYNHNHRLQALNAKISGQARQAGRSLGQGGVSMPATPGGDGGQAPGPASGFHGGGGGKGGGSGERDMKSVQCYNCQGYGHYARDCPKPPKKDGKPKGKGGKGKGKDGKGKGGKGDRGGKGGGGSGAAAPPPPVMPATDTIPTDDNTKIYRACRDRRNAKKQEPCLKFLCMGTCPMASSGKECKASHQDAGFNITKAEKAAIRKEFDRLKNNREKKKAEAKKQPKGQPKGKASPKAKSGEKCKFYDQGGCLRRNCQFEPCKSNREKLTK